MYQDLDNDLFTKANDLASQGRHEAALLSYDEILSHKDQYYSHAVFQKVLLLEQMGKHDEALLVCDEALAFEKYYKFYDLKGDLQQLHLGKPIEAEANYKQALAYLNEEIKHQSTNVYLMIEKANVLKKLNRHLEAIEEFQHAEQFTTNSEELGEVFYHKGECYEAWASLVDDIGLFEKALESFEKANRHGKSASHYIDHLTNYIRLNKALQVIDKKIAEHPEIAKHYFDKAQILWEMPNGLNLYHDIVHLLDMAEALSKNNKEKGEISYLKYVYYKKKKEKDAGYSFFDDKDTLSKKIDLLKKAVQFYKLCTKKDNVQYDLAYISKLLAGYYASLGDETMNLYFYKLALDQFIFARENSIDPYYGNVFKDSEVGIREMKEKLEGSEYSEDDKAARTVEGILYQSIDDANEARKELAAVEKIKENVDLSNYDSVLRALEAIENLSVETKAGKQLLREIKARMEELDNKRIAMEQANRKNQKPRNSTDDDDEMSDFFRQVLEEEDSNPTVFDDVMDGYEDGAQPKSVVQESFDSATPTIFDDLEYDESEQRALNGSAHSYGDSDEAEEDQYDRYVFDEDDPEIQADLISIAQVLQGDGYKRDETTAIRCLSYLRTMQFRTPIGAQFIHILERIVAQFDLKARTVNGVIYGSRYEAQDVIDEILDGHECQSETEQLEVLRFHDVVASAKQKNHQNLTLLNAVIPEIHRKKFNKELLKPYLISLLDDRSKKDLLTKLNTHQERTETPLLTQIMLWALFFTVSIAFVTFLSYIGVIIVALTYPVYLIMKRGQEYLWKFFTNNGTIPISKYEEYFARPTRRFKK